VKRLISIVYYERGKGNRVDRKEKGRLGRLREVGGDLKGGKMKDN